MNLRQMSLAGSFLTFCIDTRLIYGLLCIGIYNISRPHCKNVPLQVNPKSYYISFIRYFCLFLCHVA